MDLSRTTRAVRAVTAALAALALGAGGVVAAAPATAVPPTPAVTVDSVAQGDGSLDLTVRGEGFGAAVAGAGVYVSVGPVLGATWFSDGSTYQATKYVSASATDETDSRAPLAADGTFTVHLTGITSRYTAENGTTYDHATTPFRVVTMAAHGSGDRSFDTSTDLVFPAPDPVPSPSASPSVAPTPVPSTSPSAAPTPAPSASATPAPSATPTVTVSATTLAQDGTSTVTVTGTGFDPSLATGLYPPLAGRASGVYVVFGAFPEDWRPSDGVASSVRKNAAQRWAVPADAIAAIGGEAAGGIELRPDGSFTATLEVDRSALDAKDPVDGARYGIYTYAGGGAKVAAYETYTPLTFVPAPTVTVSRTTLPATGTTTVTVEGAGFAPDVATGVYPPLRGKPSGTYVVFGAFPETWRPSQGVASSVRKNAGQRWAVPADSIAAIGGEAAGGIELRPDGSFTATLEVDKSALDAKDPVDGARYGIYTYPGGGAAAPLYETYTPLTFTSAAPTPSPTPTSTPTPTPTPTGPAVTVDRVLRTDGSLDLTVRGSGFGRAVAGNGIYLSVGPVLGDTWYLDGSTYQATKWVNARVATETSDTAPLRADGTFTVTFTGIRSSYVANGITYDHATTPFRVVTMAAHGSTDRSFDTVTPISFAGVPQLPALPAAPPAPASQPELVVEGLAAGRVTAGGALTLTAGGFTPGESGIRVELHSDPVVLARGLVADVSGVVSTSVTIPAGTPAGVHTLHVIGASQTLRQRITVAAAPAQCVAQQVSGATLTWGVRDSFRTYVSGPVARGTVTGSGVGGNGPWTWSGGTGRFNADGPAGAGSWSGSVHFTGHNGTLDLTIADPRVQVTSASSAVLTATMTTGEGASRVTVATLALASGTRSAAGGKVTYTGVPATLTSAGAKGFAGFYEAGEALDPVSFTFPLGRDVECDASTGLAATGSDALAGVGAGAAFVLVGAALVGATRRRRAVATA